MKLLFTEGVGASQTTTNAQDEKIPVYETKTAAETDLVNLEVGQIIATKDEGNELSNPVDVVQDGNMHAVTSNAVADGLSYSTEEVKTGGKWIDGKPIYRKVVNFGALPNATIKGVSFDNINADTFVKIEGIAMSNNGSAVTIPFADTSAATQSIAIFINSSSVSINTGATNRSDYTKCYITIEYTKTTD